MANEAPTSGAPGEPGLALRTKLFGPVRGTEVRVLLPFGVPALAFAIVSMTTCFGVWWVYSILGIKPSSLVMNPHLQAVIMWGFGLLAVYALWLDRKRHHNSAPVVLGAVAVGIMIATLYIRYFIEVEIFSYVLLVVAAFLNMIAFLVALNRTVQQQTDEIQALNNRLEVKVESQVHEIERLARLKQFLAPQVADLVVSGEGDKVLETHRRYVACLFCDIRGFTSVSENIEPEEVITLLQSYHDRIGSL